MISCNHGQPLLQVGAEACEVLERDGLVTQQIEQVIVHFGAADIGHDTDALLVLAKPLLQLPELVRCLAGPGQQGRLGFGQLLHAALLPLRQPFAEQLPVGFVYGQHGGPLV